MFYCMKQHETIRMIIKNILIELTLLHHMTYYHIVTYSIKLFHCFDGVVFWSISECLCGIRTR